MSYLKIATSEPDSTFHRQGVTIGEIWQEEGVADLVTPLVTEGSIENSQLVAGARANFGCSASNWLVLAATGAPPFDAPLDIQLMTPINSGPMFFAARADSPLTAFSDLKGKRVCLGVESSGMVQHFHKILAALGFSLDDFEPVYAGVFDGWKMLSDGEVDAQFQPPIPNVHFAQLLERTPLKALPFSDEERKNILDHVPFYAEATVDAGTFKGQDAAFATIAVVNILTVRTDGDEEATYRGTRAIIERADELARRNPLFQGLDRLLADSGKRIVSVLKDAGASQHPAAERAFREAGILD